MIIGFDLDGTLLQTHTDIAECLNFSLKQYELPPIPVEIQRGFRHYRYTDYFEDVMDYLDISDPEFIEELCIIHNANYRNFMCKKGAPFEGIRECVIQLQKEGHKVCVLTNKPQDLAEPETNYWFPDIKFDLIVGTVVGETHKPHAEFMDPVYEKIACDASDIIYIGDTLTDYQFAQNCGVLFIGVGWGYDSGNAMRKEAEIMCENPDELLDCIRSLNHNK